MKTLPKIVVVGSANTDLVLQLPRLPRAGESVIGSRFLQALGGKGANQAVAAARLGAEVTFVCKLGRDEYGQGCYRAYQAEGLSLEHVFWDEETASGVAFIFVSENGENLIGVAPGANMRLTADEVEQAAAAIAAADCLLIQQEVSLLADLKAVQIARQHGVQVILNPAPPDHLPVELLELVNYLTPNETELDFLVRNFADQAGSLAAAFTWLRRMVPHLVVTLGAQGCRLVTNERDELVPAFAVKAVDTTAAGDAFNGALAVALARGLGLKAAALFASAAGALSVTRLGAMNSLPTAAEVDSFLSSTG
jgi:ribokinase